MPLQSRLARIRIPLRPMDRDAVLDLQQSLDRAYDLGRFWMRVDYSRPPIPPLPAEDNLWANKMIEEWAKAQK
jgi:hypothetical protein